MTVPSRKDISAARKTSVKPTFCKRLGMLAEEQRLNRKSTGKIALRCPFLREQSIPHFASSTSWVTRPGQAFFASSGPIARSAFRRKSFLRSSSTL